MGRAPEERLYHQPVMAEEVAGIFRTIEEGVIVDATFGGGGHTRRLVEQSPPAVRILALDRDPAAGAQAGALGPGVRLVEANFSRLAEVLEEEGIDEIAGALFDLGVSSRQLDDPQRGFSYNQQGPLDMRMGPDSQHTAQEVVNAWPVEQLADVIRRFGEERFAGRIASAIIEARPVRGTTELAEVVRRAIPAASRRRGGHPARRTFQAIRMAVNDELGALESGLEAALSALRLGGRVAVISYHSLEDRLVKRRFARGGRGCVCPPELPVCSCGRVAELRLLTRRALRPSQEEVARNRRARSARLRAAEKVAAV
ncbi:MAG: 16S rRNA (cytosine(1402)-N(4))-methyltransferase RsmH [Actinomycetota bacterium]|nr:16S rRNA (cytosine(1402)-N(4))-methyltransferase RsmH [Actinomycetota bacterium]